MHTAGKPVHTSLRAVVTDWCARACVYVCVCVQAWKLKSEKGMAAYEKRMKEQTRKYAQDETID